MGRTGGLVVLCVGGAILTVEACVGDSTDLATDAGADAATADAADGQAADSSRDSSASDGAVDASDAATPACNPAADFGAPTPLTDLNTGYNTMSGVIDPTTHEFYYARWAYSATVPDYHPKTPSRIFKAAFLDAGVFGTPALVSGVSDPNLDAGDYDYFPTVTADGLNLYFDSYRAATPNSDVYLSTRSTTSAAWGDAGVSVFANISQEVYPIAGAIYTPNNGPLYRYQLDGTDGVGSSVNVDPDAGTINAGNVFAPVITPDELHLYFTSTRAPATSFRIFGSTRASTSAPWSVPSLVSLGVSGGYEMPSYITPDNCTLYFSSSRSGPMQMYYATRGR